ncbi:acyltransferase [Streptomyces liangshanensis]|uniref:Acyltransferase n=1 Tax=Streptomyces liangshanensis TaxID=2717324 RepID=A0A6G9GZ36_9ACTN|nr:acyltransferase [Streptomyces liangshanensis]QIQ03326.1 acyltransferase [Streptomyces liangshanensis]
MHNPGLLPTTPPVPAPVTTPAVPRVREHRYDIDLIRVLASVGVIVCHAAGELMTAVGRSPAGGSPVYWTAVVADGLSRCAVPLFFAMAGWVVLSGAPPRDGAQVRTRLTRILVPMAVWTAAYLLWGWVRDTNPDPTRSLALDALFGTVRPAFHLWYLYTYAPVILLLSTVVLIRAGKRPWGPGVALLALALAPTLRTDANKLLDLQLPSFTWTFTLYQVVYAVAGALLLTVPRSVTTGRRRRLLWLAAAGCAWAAVVAEEHYVHFPSPYASPFVALLVGALLMAFNGLTVPERLRPLLTRLGGAAFGAYLVHLFFLQALAPHLVTARAGWLHAPALLAALTVATVGLSFVASLLWERLRLRRWLG